MVIHPGRLGFTTKYLLHKMTGQCSGHYFSFPAFFSSRTNLALYCQRHIKAATVPGKGLCCRRGGGRTPRAC